jgi:hypothetical protein
MNDPFERAVLRQKLERKERRTRHVAAAFRTHLMIFVIVNAGLVLVWLVQSALDDGSSWEDPWFAYSLVAWGIALAFHGWNVRAHTQRDAALRARLGDSEATP